ncbi:N-acetylmuramoyl-L-alanine amidase [Scytonema hofmannii FACHB-248]|uniref:N-acetylmuramoyl-L-alanine amidase n=1 Tax=Scytonema hofmannii FACHB-248 TaxID=1842502 RepID=A0ABR8H282_9CYAN|nr:MULTISPECIES: N-acetylmuramoyl-L-alanine amidase [Nostocales]MBD2609579.1 N-acetylmuramoyl-L-alanine amidase [Scytonema hofmannii FACHB-248]
MKYGIDCGHGCPPDTGASGNGQLEDRLTLAVGHKVMAQLQALGHEVVDCRPKSASSVSSSLSQRCLVANKLKVDIFVSIHFNAFNKQAHGAEVFAASSKGSAVAQKVVDAICFLGFSDRGVKDGSHLYVLKNTSMPAILVECCFIDSKADMDLFDADKMATAIVRGLTGLTVTPTPKTPDTNKWQEFIKVLKSTSIQYPQLKVAQLAQAIVESGRGTSKLFLQHNNPYGLKWRREMSAISTDVSYQAHDGLDSYCKFATLEDAVKGYWLFIAREPYRGWEKYSSSPREYLRFIVDAGYCPDNGYVNKVVSVLPEAQKLLS